MSKAELVKTGLKVASETVVTRGRNFIYLPRRYDSNPEYAQWKSSVEQIHWQTAGHNMTAFVDCNPEQKPERVWLMFGGNASVALDWLPVTTFAPPSSDAFVLFDYPGYGECEGKPERGLIRQSIDDLVETVCDRFSLSAEDKGAQFSVMGHSLGAAVALETAVRHRVENGILISPFSSVQKMGERMFGKIISRFAADPYDNVQSIKEAGNNGHDPHFHIIHGVLDDIIPVEMAGELHAAAPDHTTLWKIPDANHNDILLVLSKELGCALTNGGKFSYENP